MKLLTLVAHGVASVAVIFGGLSVLSPSASAAQIDQPAVPARASCGSVSNVSVGVPRAAATAHWELACKNGKVTVSGWVKDVAADGQCAKVKALFEGQITEYSAAACPSGVKKTFSWSHPGSIADVYLYTYDV